MVTHVCGPDRGGRRDPDGDLIPSIRQPIGGVAPTRRSPSASPAPLVARARRKLDRTRRGRYGGAMRRAWAVVLVVVAATAAAPTRAHAADVTDVASAFDEDNPFDFR